MKISIITPSHSLEYINELYNTIITQTYSDWEWIVFLNGSASKSQLSSTIRNDKRVKVLKKKLDKDLKGNIGYLKHEAFNCGKGEILVEVDHDDLLTDNCLELLHDAFQDPEIGFVYSNNAQLHTSGMNPTPYNPIHGWTYKSYNYKNTELLSMNSFKPDAASMAFVWFMPDHVRAWRKSVYKSIDGHDKTLAVLDDQDLITRTYLVTKFKFIDEVLYIYRIHGNNTWLLNVDKIQQETVNIFHKYGYKLAERDAELNNLMKVDLGGGIDGRPGYTTIDLMDANINCDLNNGIPLADNSVGVLNASNLIEHLHDRVKTMSEIHRVVADGGWVMIDVPSTDGRGAFQDPSHASYWNVNSFYYYTDKSFARYIRNTTIRFQEFRLETGFQNEWQKALGIVMVRVWLRVIKSDTRRPHLIKI